MLPAMSAHQRAPSGRIAYQPALDGLRGIALLFVLAYHAEFAWARGGFLPLPTFFVLSGYLITSLFLAERDRSGAIALGAFWARRLRRLMPAALLGLLGVSVFGAWLTSADQFARLRGDVLWTLVYLANWRFVAVDTAYTQLFVAPSPLQHFWSLAVEEQFYLVYPLVVVAGFAGAGGGTRRLAWLLIGLTALSIAASVGLSLSGASIDRLYYGTDTRGAELAVGCLLGVALHGRRIATSRALDVAGAIGLAAMLATWTFFDLEWRWLYPGGLLGYALLTALVIAAGVQPESLVRRALSGRVLCWMGRVSYGVYIFHWPLFLWLTPERTGLEPWPLFGARLAASFGVAAVSYYAIEQPIRVGRGVAGRHPWIATPIAMGAVATAAVVGTASAPGGAIDLESANAEFAKAGGQASEAGEGDPNQPAVATFGDSTALRLGLELSRLYAENGAAQPRRGAAQMGCGMLEEGVFRFRGRERERPEACGDRDRKFTRTVKRGDPDVSVVAFGPWDVTDRALPGTGRWLAPGDPDLDAALLAAMNEVVDALTVNGGLVLWLTSPVIVVRDDRNAVPATPFPESDPARMHRFNALLGELATARPDDVRIVDLAGHLRSLPGGELDASIRPDGIHMTRESARRVVRDWLGAEVLRVWADARGERAPR